MSNYFTYSALTFLNEKEDSRAQAKLVRTYFPTTLLHPYNPEIGKQTVKSAYVNVSKHFNPLPQHISVRIESQDLNRTNWDYFMRLMTIINYAAFQRSVNPKKPFFYSNYLFELLEEIIDDKSFFGFFSHCGNKTLDWVCENFSRDDLKVSQLHKWYYRQITNVLKSNILIIMIILCSVNKWPTHLQQIYIEMENLIDCIANQFREMTHSSLKHIDKFYKHCRHPF